MSFLVRLAHHWRTSAVRAGRSLIRHYKRLWPSKAAPARRYLKWNHSSPGEHSTAEELNWRIVNRLNLMTLLATTTAATFAAYTYTQAKRQADIAKWALAESGRPAIYVSVNELVANAEQSVGFSIQNIAPAPAIVDYVEFHVSELPDHAFTIATECYVKIGERIVTDRLPILDTCKFGLTANPAHPLFYGFVSYKSISGVRWRRSFEYYRVSSTEWAEDGDSIRNRDVRIDDQGVELLPP